MFVSRLALCRGLCWFALACGVASCGGDEGGAPQGDSLPAEQRPIIPGAIERGGARGRLAQGPSPAFVDPSAPVDAPWAGAVVEARTLGGMLVASATTEADGAFTLEKLPTGLIRLQAGPEAAAARADVTIVPGVTVEVGKTFAISRAQAAAAAVEGVPPTAIVAGTMNPLPAGAVIYPAAMPDGAAPVEGSKKTLAADSYLFFVDTTPALQLGHPLEYVLVDAATGAVERTDKNSFLPVVNHGKLWRSIDGLVLLPFDVGTTAPADFSPNVVPVVSPEFARAPTEMPKEANEKTVDQQPLPLAPAGSIAQVPFDDGAKMPASRPLSHFNNTGADGVFVVLLSTGNDSAFEQNIGRMGGWLNFEGVPLANMARATIGNVPAPAFDATTNAAQNRQAAVARQIQRATLHFEPQIRARLEQGKHSTLIVYLTGHGGPSGMNLDFLGDTTGSFIAGAAELGLEQTRACRLRVIIQSCQSGGFQEKIAEHLATSGHDLQIFAAANKTKYAQYTPGWVSYIPVVNLLRQGGSEYTKELVEELDIENGDITGLTETLADGSVVQASDMRELSSLPPPPFLRPAHPPWCFPGEGAGGAGGSGTSPTGGGGGSAGAGAGGASPTEPSVRLDYDLVPGELKAGDLVEVSRFTGGHVADQDKGCDTEHFHADGPDGVRVDGKGPFADKAPSGCGFGKIVAPAASPLAEPGERLGPRRSALSPSARFGPAPASPCSARWRESRQAQEPRGRRQAEVRWVVVHPSPRTMRAPLSASFFLSWLATTAAAHADEPAPKAPSSEGAIPGQRGWIADGNLGVPILKSGEVKVVANGTLGYRWKKVEFITSAGANQYSSRSDNVFNDTVRTGVWLTLAYVTGEPGEPLRLLLLLDQSYAGYRTWYRRLPEAPAFDPKDPLTFDLSLEREVSHMLRSTMLFGLLLAPSDRAQARVVLGVGTQHEIFVRSTFEHADTGTEASLDVDASLTLRQLSRVAARYQLVPGALAVRLTSDATRFKLRRGSAAVKINLSSLAANTSVALFTFTQIEATNRLSFDVEKLGFLGLMPAASVGLDVSSLSGDVGKSTAVVPVFGLGLTNGRL